MAEVKIINKEGKEVGTLTLSDSVFKTEIKEHLMQLAVRSYQNARRSGTATTKGKGEIIGSGRKLYKQKGTGNARFGQKRTPIRRGGGVAFPKYLRDFSIKMNKKEKNSALLSALSQRFADFMVLNELKVETPKTKEITQLKKKLSLPLKTLIVVKEPDIGIDLSVRNIPETKWVSEAYLNVYDLLYFDKIVFTQDAILGLEKRLKNEKLS